MIIFLVKITEIPKIKIVDVSFTALHCDMSAYDQESNSNALFMVLQQSGSSNTYFFSLQPKLFLEIADELFSATFFQLLLLPFDFNKVFDVLIYMISSILLSLWVQELWFCRTFTTEIIFTVVLSLFYLKKPVSYVYQA